MALDYYFDPDDKLDRFGYAKFLRDLIENCDQYKRDESSEAYSIAIDSSWGTGKTYFFKMFENYLYGQKSANDPVPESNPEFIVVNYNAWSNDYWDDAFSPFMQSILDNDRFMGTESTNKLRRIFESIIQSSDSTPAKIYTNYRSSSPLVQLRQKQQAMQALKNCLNKMILACQNRGLKKLVIIIDELDRCKPLFAIQTLEIVKHFLDVKDVVFIFAIDLEQLSHSVESVYGSGMNASGYLCKFFDYITKFPQPNLIKIITELLPKELSERKYIVDTSSRYLKSVPSMANFIQTLYSGFQLSIRDVQTIILSYRIMFNSFLYEYENLNAHKLYLILLAIKYKNPEDYQTMLTKPAERAKIKDKLPSEITLLYRNSNFFKDAFNSIFQNTEAYIYVDKFDCKPEKISVKNLSRIRDSNMSFINKDTPFPPIDLQYPEEIYGILFYPDFKHLIELQSAPYADYVFKRLENFNFPDIIKSTK